MSTSISVQYKTYFYIVLSSINKKIKPQKPMEKKPNDLEKTVKILSNMAHALKKNSACYDTKKELLQKAGFNKILEKGLKNGSIDLKREEIAPPDLQKIMKKMSDFLEKIQKKST